MRNCRSILLLLVGCLFVLEGWGQLNITQANTVYTIDFDNTVAGVNEGQFTGSGFTPSPVGGQLNSEAWRVVLSGTDSINFGATEDVPSTNYTRGIHNGGVSTGGVYAFTINSSPINRAIGIQPTEDQFTPGRIVLRMINNTGCFISTVQINYNILVFNDRNRANSFNFSYSLDDQTYIPVSSLDFTSTELADGSPKWDTTSMSVTLDGIFWEADAYLYIAWDGDDVSGSGERDEFALDDITIEAKKSNDQTSEVVAPVSQISSGQISSLANSVGSAVDVFRFRVTDAGGDGLPTTINRLRFEPGPGNQADWATVLKGVVLKDNNGTAVPLSTVTISNDELILVPATGISVSDNSSMDLVLAVYLQDSTLTDNEDITFSIPDTLHGFMAANSGSGFACSFPASVSSNTFSIEVVATHLAFAQQPTSTTVLQPFNPIVAVEATDVHGNRDLDFNQVVTLSLTSSACNSLIDSTANAASGLAEFNDLQVGVSESNVSLTASSSPLAMTFSNAFNVDYQPSVLETLVLWNFEDQNTQADGGLTVNLTNHISREPSGTYAYPAGASGSSISCIGWDGGMNTKYWEVELNAEGYQDIMVSSKQQSSNTGPRDFKLQYRIGSGGTWTDAPGGATTVANNFTSGVLNDLPLPSACHDQPSLFLRWIMYSNSAVDGGIVGSTGTSRIDDIFIKGYSITTASNKYYQTKANGDFANPCHWEYSDDGTNWFQAASPPDVSALTITVRDGDTLTLSSDVDIDNLIIEAEGAIICDGGSFTFHNGSGVDLVVLGTYEDRNTNSYNVEFLNGATWQLGIDAVFVKTNSSSAANYRDNYEGTTSTIPATATWILRKNTITNPIYSSTGGMHYPNLVLENYYTWSWNNSFFTGIAGSTRPIIKGNFDIGGNGTNSIVFYNRNLNPGLVRVEGDIIIRQGNTLSNEGSVSPSRSPGAGFEVLGDIIIENGASFIVNGADSSTGRLKFSGTQIQSIINHGGTLLLNDLHLACTGPVSVDAFLEVEGTLILDSGILDMDVYPLYLSGQIPQTEGNPASYIRTTDGLVIRKINSGATYTFPVGHNPYMPLRVSCGSCTDVELQVRVRYKLDIDPDDPASPKHVSHVVDAQWVMETADVVPDITVELEWPSSEQLQGFYPTQTFLRHWEGGVSTSWLNQTPAAQASGTDPYARSWTISSLPIGTHFFGVGGNALLLSNSSISLSASPGLAGMLLTWQAGEMPESGSHWIVERHTGAGNWEALTELATVGNSREWLDSDPDFGQNYYRIAHLGPDGTRVWSNIATGRWERQGIWYIGPNPASTQINITASHLGEGLLRLDMFHSSGTRVLAIQAGSGPDLHELLPISNLAPGVYVLVVSRGSEPILRERIVIQR